MGPENYLAFINLEAPPFSIVPDLNFSFPGIALYEVLEVLSFAINQENLIIVLTGEPGLGKTQIILTLTQILSENLQILFINNPPLSPSEFFKSLFEELSIKDNSHELNEDLI